MRSLLPLAILTTCSALASPARGEDAVPDSSASDNPALREAAALTQRFEARLPDQSATLARVDRPLLLFGDDARNLTRGTLWGWGSGRPAAIAELWRGRAEHAPYAVSLTLLAASPIVLSGAGPRDWRPESPQIEFRQLTASPPPGNKAAAHLRQMKDIARQFTAHEIWDPDNSRFELRLLVQPIHRYQDPAEELVDGAVFVLANGTNPEAFLLIEAAGPAPDKCHWQYGLARTSNAELHVALAEKEVWTCERVKSGSTRPNHPYFVLSLPAPEPKPMPTDEQR